MRWILALLVVAALTLPSSGPVTAASPSPVGRELQLVVLHGSDVPALSTSARFVPTPPAPMAEWDGSGTIVPDATDGSTSGWPVDEITASANGAPIRIQVDERFDRYLTNYASGFGIYSQADLETTYAFDWEGRHKECNAIGDALTATFCPGPHAMADPVAGLDDGDEIVVAWGDLATTASGAPGEVRALDPLSGEARFVTITAGAPLAAAPLVTYAPDADADTYVQSNHGSYGGAPGGACYPGDGVDAPWGTPSASCDHRRPKDSATISTPRYQFHYAGRWKMDGLSAARGDGSYSDSLIDRWKGRAFQQREGNAADIGGFEDENDWTKSSVTMGVRAGPLRAMRETWGADSGTDVTRLDVFEPARFVQVYHLRVHPIPPDGIYAFWDHREGMMDTYYTALRPEGVPIDGQNDELYGTNSEWQQDLLGQPFFTIDVPDPTLQAPVTNEMWDEVAGPFASLVTFIATPPGFQAGPLTPYYRDDSSFDDGTGTDPGSFGAHGIHFFATTDTDNVFLPAPIDEFVAVSTQYVLPAGVGNVGESVAQLERVPVVVG